MEYRINGFEQIKSFYSIVFEQKFEIKTQHISLYVFLINQNNRNNWVEWFKCPFDLAMAGSCIGNKKTYYKCLSDLQEWGLLKYEKGVNDYKAPKIKLEVLNNTSTETATVPQSEPLLQPLLQPQGIPLGTQIYKLITDNIKQINKNDLILIRDFVLKNIDKESRFDFLKSLIDLGVDEKIAKDWMLVRKKKEATNTETALKAIVKEINLSGLTANECIEIAVVKSWSGFKTSWLKQEQTLMYQQRPANISKYETFENGIRKHNGVAVPLDAPPCPDNNHRWSTIHNKWTIHQFD